MAERRMFAKTVTDDDSFIMMPATTQNLYFHLAMKADDDGFVNSPKSIIRLIGANENDFDVLILKRFVLKFDTGVIVIRHWKIHNYIQKDRYKETRYLQEKKLLQENPNREYVEKAHVSTTDTGCIQSVHGMDAQIRIDKNSQDEISEDEISIEIKGADAPTPTKTAFGEYGWIKLTDAQRDKFIADFGESEFNRCVTHVDESAQSTGNKNKWKDWNLVIRRCHKDGWGLKVDKYGEPVKVSNRKEKILSD